MTSCPSAVDHRASRRRVLDALSEIAPCSRARLVERSGLSRTTVAAVVTDLLAERVLVETRERPGPGTGVRGRRPSVLRWSEDAGLVTGIDVGHSHVTVAVATVDAAVIAEETGSIAVDASPHDTILMGVALVERALARCGRRVDDLVSVGVGVPAPVAPGARTVTEGLVMRSWNGVDVVGTFEQHLAVGVTIENDANLGALAEQRFSTRTTADVDDLVYVKVSSGIGAGVVSNGRLVHGFSGRAGELGHLSVRPDGRVCRCGNRGCLETVAAIPCIIGDLADAHPRLHDLPGLVALLDRGDDGARRAVHDAGYAVGQALAPTVCLLSPSQVVVNGLDSTTDDSFLDGLRGGIARFFHVDHWPDLTIRNSTFGERNELLGAVQLAIVTRPHDAAVTGTTWS